MMGAAIGAASDFYRVRLTHLDGVEGPDFEWHQDILYRRPAPSAPEEYELYRVEAVALDDDEDMTPIGSFHGSDEAHEALGAASDDLAVLTRAEFEKRYFQEVSVTEGGLTD
jgi:DNA-directed RNA polymerase specialized sigma24 family protein